MQGKRRSSAPWPVFPSPSLPPTPPPQRDDGLRRTAGLYQNSLMVLPFGISGKPLAACSHLHTPNATREPQALARCGSWLVGAHPSFFGVARMAETIVGRIIIRVVGRKKGMLSRLRAKATKYSASWQGVKIADVYTVNRGAGGPRRAPRQRRREGE